MSWAAGLPSGLAQGAWPKGRTTTQQGNQGHAQWKPSGAQPGRSKAYKACSKLRGAWRCELVARALGPVCQVPLRGWGQAGCRVAVARLSRRKYNKELVLNTQSALQSDRRRPWQRGLLLIYQQRHCTTSTCRTGDGNCSPAEINVIFRC